MLSDGVPEKLHTVTRLVVLPPKGIDPFTSNLALGIVVPIPTLPVELIVRRGDGT